MLQARTNPSKVIITFDSDFLSTISLLITNSYDEHYCYEETLLSVFSSEGELIRQLWHVWHMGSILDPSSLRRPLVHCYRTGLQLTVPDIDMLPCGECGFFFVYMSRGDMTSLLSTGCGSFSAEMTKTPALEACKYL